MFSSNTAIAMTNFKLVKMEADSFLAGTVIANWDRFVTDWGSFCYCKSGLWVLQYETTLILTVWGRVANWASCYKKVHNNC